MSCIVIRFQPPLARVNHFWWSFPGLLLEYFGDNDSVRVNAVDDSPSLLVIFDSQFVAVSPD